MNKSLISMAIALALTAGTAHAERGAHRQSFTLDKTRTSDRGTASRHLEQSVTATGFTRSSAKTNVAGEKATRDRAVVRDKEAGLRTSTVAGTTFNGKSYSGESVQQRTENGYTSEGSFTGPNGKTSTRSAVATIDKENGTLTKNIGVTTPNGEVHNTTVVKTIGKPDAGAQ